MVALFRIFYRSSSTRILCAHIIRVFSDILLSPSLPSSSFHSHTVLYVCFIFKILNFLWFRINTKYTFTAKKKTLFIEETSGAREEKKYRKYFSSSVARCVFVFFFLRCVCVCVYIYSLRLDRRIFILLLYFSVFIFSYK